MRKLHYGWIILLLSFFSLLIVQGFRSSFGAFVVPWEEHFASNRSTISFIATLSLIMYGVSQPIVGKILDYWGVRVILSFSTLLVGMSTLLTFLATEMWHMYLLYGIIASIGFGGASGVTATVAVAHWFEKRKGLALGIITSGMSAGQLVLVPLCLALIERIGWQYTVLGLGAFLIGIAFPVLYIFLRTRPEEVGVTPYGHASDGHASDDHANDDHASTYAEQEKPENEKLGNEHAPAHTTAEKPSVWGIFQTHKFWFLAIPYFICGYTTLGLIDTHFIPYCHNLGLTSEITGGAVGLLATFNIIGTLASGQIADHWSSKNLLGILYLTRAFALLGLLFIFQPSWLMVFAIVIGLVNFATITPTSVLATEYFKNYSVGFVLGLLFLTHQIGASLGAYIPGRLYDVSGYYHSTFISVFVMLIIASVCSFLLPETKRKIVSPKQRHVDA